MLWHLRCESMANQTCVGPFLNLPPMLELWILPFRLLERFLYCTIDFHRFAKRPCTYRLDIKSPCRMASFSLGLLAQFLLHRFQVKIETAYLEPIFQWRCLRIIHTLQSSFVHALHHLLPLNLTSIRAIARDARAERNQRLPWQSQRYSILVRIPLPIRRILWKLNPYPASISRIHRSSQQKSLGMP